jgi:protein-tyrosine phosphatase
MPSDIYWIQSHAPVRLAIMARPRSGDWLEDEVDNWRGQGIELVVSLLEPHEVRELELEAEPGLCGSRGIEFVSFPISDRGVPEEWRDAVDLACKVKDGGKATAIHCRAGIGRSSLVAALVLRLAGSDVTEAFAAIGQARGLAVPDTEGQRSWVMGIGERLGGPGRSDGDLRR